MILTISSLRQVSKVTELPILERLCRESRGQCQGSGRSACTHTSRICTTSPGGSELIRLSSRLRHVKCDEAKPFCARCLKADFECGGYANNDVRRVKKPPVKTRLPPLAPKQQNSVSLPLNISSSLVPLSLTKPGGWFNDEFEYQYFSFWNVEFMQLKCSTTYLAAFESDLWSRLIPQVAFEEEFAKHAMIALGAMNKAAEALPAAYEKHSPYNDRHHETALKYQGKVIKLLRQQLKTPCLDERNVQTILVACLLLGCFENAHGGVRAILPLFQSGVKVLSDFNENRREQNLVSTSTGSSIIESGLIEMFLHFETYLYNIEGQALDSRASYRNSDDTRALANMPSEFTTLRQARMYLDLIRRLSLNLFRAGSESSLQPGLQSNSDVSHVFESTSLRGADEWYHRSMLNWQKSFDPLLESCRAITSDTRFCKAASYLEMKQFIIDLDRPDTLKSYYPNAPVLELCVKVSTLARQLLESEDEVLGRGPTMPRYDMLLEEVVSPMFRAADRDGSSVIREMGNDLLHKYSASEELHWIKRIRSNASMA